MWTWFHRLASPPHFYRIAERWAPWVGVAAFGFLVWGWLGGLIFAPADYQQKDAFRIIYVHVPTAAVSLSLYTAMAAAGFVALIWRMKLAEVALVAIAPVGAAMTAVALVTGMLWGKPMWGTYWVWDARLTAELVLLFLYLGVLGLNQAFEDARAGARACSLLALVGVVNVPIVKYSVEWWNSLHQTSTILKLGKPTITGEMAVPLYAALLGTFLLCAYAVLRRVQNELLARERRASWVKELVRQSGV
ncbi:heme ABC transporter permease [Sinimarinibacterium sp. NLF-5-8]|uniref:heme ABC transporter permease n=1 Tax=Sinimarinibacterium sp. NLF-5-8 TaxID=2698684 RepID=UPI00137C02AB|nr:heme ABC transporter permease [Sinimarinibacterium sp. NLF-5-8]QHS08684.1 heme ABC transporter permease [Sinimarinibacterium sp. NLF-5-8]